MNYKSNKFYQKIVKMNQNNDYGKPLKNQH